MRILAFIAIALTLAVACGSTLPDLEVCNLLVGEPVAGAHDDIEVPIAVTVCNTGKSPAGNFRVTLLYTTAGLGPFTLTFTVAGQVSEEYPMTDWPLAPEESVTFQGKAVFPGDMAGEYVRIMAEADSCMSGDSVFCMVDESYEDNNLSGDILLLLR